MSRKATRKKKCRNCGKEQGLYNYYTASNALTSSDGKTIDICKDCIKKMSVNEDGSINLEKFRNVLRLIDKPFLKVVLEQAVKEAASNKAKTGKNYSIIGLYFKNITTLKQYSNLTYADSLRIESGEDFSSESTTETKKANNSKGISDTTRIMEFVNDFEVTDEIKELFGEGFTRQEYKMMNKKYQDLKVNYPIKTNMHKEFLVDYVKCKVKEEMSIVQGDIEAVGKWSALASKAAENAKITPKQLTAADLQGGLSSFSEIFEAVEGAKDVIDILPRFTQQPNDMPDFIIWNYINYERELNNLPRVSYKEIYQFYDKRKAEYIKEHGDPFGIFANDNSQGDKERRAIEKFITVADEFSDEENGDSNG